jgi:SAM-dependent methyltransferase
VPPVSYPRRVANKPRSEKSPQHHEGVLLPYPPYFPKLLDDYCEQIGVAIRANQHHDTRRHLFLNFLREAFNIDPVEVELEHKLKAGELRGRIDALYRHIIVEVKTDFDNERDDAQRELKKYFASRQRPSEYIGIVTDGRRFEAWHLNLKGELLPISETELRSDDPLSAWRWLDQFLSTGVRRVPTSDELVSRFGVLTPVFTKAADTLLALYESVKHEPVVAVKFREWNSLLAKVYGSPLGKPTLFVNHTYLTLISRIIVTLALRGGVPKKAELRGLLDGSFFSRQFRLRNLAEPDFFSWALDTKAEDDFLVLLGNLFRHFGVYDFSQLSEDVLKNLYQELIDPETRHNLGEYYTPDWLAELTLERLDYKGGRILDPACGSGGFLFAAIHSLRRAGREGSDLVQYALEHVIGIDVHPVAVLMAKANMLLALRHELPSFQQDVTLRVYMADTLMAEEDKSKGVLTIPVTGKEAFHIPLATVARGELDELIDFMSDFARRGSKDEKAAEKATSAINDRLAKLDSKERFWWLHNFKLLMKLDKQRRNTIWAYILKNAYRPEFLRGEKVDYIAGNPPWLGYAFIKDLSYQRRIKELTFNYGLLSKDDIKLFTRMDAWSVFFVHCEAEFLRDGGQIGFVLPKSAMLPAKQHVHFQKRGFKELHDFTGVSPLFKVRSCLVLRSGRGIVTGIPFTEWRGELPRKNMGLADAKKILRSDSGTFDLVFAPEATSPYYDQFFQGATIVPRVLCFVKPVDHAAFNSATPFIRTSEDILDDAKKPWTMEVEGQIESKYLFGTVLAGNLMPFVVRKFSLLALPVVLTKAGDLVMVDAAEALSQGEKHAYDWFSQAEGIWEKKRKAEGFTFSGWLNYHNKITEQSPHAEFIVLYNQSGTNIAASLVTQKEFARIGAIPIRGYVIDSKTYYHYPESEDEGHYLVGILNTAFVNDAIKPLQPEGLMGARDIHRRPFEACNIPLFDAKNELHQQIAQVSAAARAELLPVVPKMESPVATARADARRLVQGKLSKLDELTRQLLQTSATMQTKPKPSKQPEFL